MLQDQQNNLIPKPNVTAVTSASPIRGQARSGFSDQNNLIPKPNVTAVTSAPPIRGQARSGFSDQKMRTVKKFMRCPNCQTINPANAKFCLECGNRLLVCPNCQTVNLPIAKFCIECGTRLQAAQTKASVGGPTAPMSVVQAETRSPSNTAPLPAPTSTASSLLLPPEERRVVTIMFADITGSTPLADRLDPEDMRAILTGYFNLMTQQIRKHGGIVEKYIGDAVMAVFGAPIAHEDDPDRAIRASLDMQTALNQFNEQRGRLDPQATRLQMRIGINTGEVAIPNSNTHQRQDFLITGDAVNVAARLQQAAAPDTILVGERTYLTTREVFEFSPMAPLQLKGKAEPITASVVLNERKGISTTDQHPRGIKGRQVRLVGRSLELTLIHANYARVLAERQPHLITILGSPGIGKSRLVREFIKREQEKVKSASSYGKLVVPRVLKGRCPPYGEGITYWPLIEILRSLLPIEESESNEQYLARLSERIKQALQRSHRTESADEIVNTIIRSVGRGLDERQGSPEKEKGKELSPKQISNQAGPLLRAWRIFLEALAEEQPLIIVVDDLQWANEALLDLLEYLTDRVTDVPILFLCPARPDFFERRREWGGGRRNFTTIELDALSPEESSELIDAHLNTEEFPEFLRQSILARTEGNPFFVEEIIRMLIDQGTLIYESDPNTGQDYWRLGRYNEMDFGEFASPLEHSDELLNMPYLLPMSHLPDTIQGVLAARIDLLKFIEKRVLQHASIIGRTFWLSQLRELAPDIQQEVLTSALDALIQRDFITEIEKHTRNIIPDDRTFAFKHVLIRDVVYNNIPRTRRSREHAVLAQWLEEKTREDRDTYIELLAYHYQQALVNWSINMAYNPLEFGSGARSQAHIIDRPELRKRAIRYLTLAGDQALHSYYTLRALQAYNDALELQQEGETEPFELVRMHFKLGDAHWQRGNADEAWQEYRKSLRLVTEAQEPIAIEAIELVDIYERLGELGTRMRGMFRNPPALQEIRSYIDQGLALLDTNQQLAKERVYFLTYQAFWNIRQLEATPVSQKVALAEQALASGHEALNLAEKLNLPIALSLTLDALSFIYRQYNKYREAHELQHRRYQLESQLTEREELYDLYGSLGLAHEETGDYSAALMWFGRAYSNAQTMENPILLLESMVGRMRAWRQWNRWDEARQVAIEILALIDQYQLENEKLQFWALETLATIAYRQGKQEEGDRYYRQCQRLVEQQMERGEEHGRNLQATRLHAIHLAREDWTLATADYKEKLRISEPIPTPETLATLAELLVSTGEDAEKQEELCERALLHAQESGARKSEAIALRGWGRLHTERKNWKLAEDYFKQALTRCEALDLPWEQGLTLYYLGIQYARRAEENNDKAQKRNSYLSRARYHLERALGFFEALKAQPQIERLRLVLMQTSSTRV
ncbi:hypothetical protein KSD_21890 [Ktedonobacter sp. SOSP1-85]|uniref:adenylate/guanylate cyclase domain-containing protein n=1 Tax=Ktedonobacter sp. SOSP1-85 TaxID=2778367 RepID=UPI0019165BBC|nr:adenylate/guanylate cyclase domain-containing protein [Ktedonobacter sp. SOSP1-85]GHO74418.1 hypothetical protein KSD_21890 [Ktedonobacter sp. SOSP1-85]